MLKLLDKIYTLFAIMLLAGMVALDHMHWPVWPKAWILPFSIRIEQYYIKTYNDPLSANLSVPNGWQWGIYFFEQLDVPFLLYYLFAKGMKSNYPATDCRWHQEGTWGYNYGHANRRRSHYVFR